jgi:carbamoyltransferase
MLILGINAYHADAAAAIVCDGRLIAVAEEERFNRVKHSAGFPYQAVNFCLREVGARLKDVDHVAVAQSPNSNWLNETTTVQSDQFLMGGELHDRFLFPAEIKSIPNELKSAVGENGHLPCRFHSVPHHIAHSASAFLVSKLDQAAIACIDSFGDLNSTLLGRGTDRQIEIFKLVPFPHSLGILYSMITQYLGFPNYGDEWKVMGLAAYGEPRFRVQLQELVLYSPSEGFELNLDYFTHHLNGFRSSWSSSNPRIERLYSGKMIDKFGPARLPGEELKECHFDMAASLQSCLESGVISLLQDLYERSNSKNCVLAGGVALNSVLNSRIPEYVPFHEIYVPPAAGDSGTAVGAAFYVYNVRLDRPRAFQLEHSYWGPAYNDEQCRNALDNAGLAYRQVEDAALIAAHLIASGKIVGWFQGRMEFGPRALGNRSILADPRLEEVKTRINRQIKFREDFRPFAASILANRVGDLFMNPAASPYMSEVFHLKRELKGLYPATTHLDGTTRLQTVSSESNPLFFNLISEFEKLSGVPMVLNTSMNQQEPIVCTPEDAIHCYKNSGLDALFLGKYLTEKRPESKLPATT